MAAPHLISRTLDPLFALTIGILAATNRIRREERERWHLVHPASSTSSYTTSSNTYNASDTDDASTTTTTPTPIYPTPSTDNTPDTYSTPPRTRHASATAVEQRLVRLEREPRLSDTWNTLRERLRRVDVWGWDVRELWRRREAWGVHEPNR